MVIKIPANVKHWHGAKRDIWFSHIAVEVQGKENSNEWLEALTDEEYNKLKKYIYKIERKRRNGKSKSLLCKRNNSRKFN